MERGSSVGDQFYTIDNTVKENKVVVPLQSETPCSFASNVKSLVRSVNPSSVAGYIDYLGI